MILAWHRGASPLRAEIMKRRSVENQTFYLVKFMFPRGDASSLLFGFDAGGRTSPALVLRAWREIELTAHLAAHCTSSAGTKSTSACDDQQKI